MPVLLLALACLTVACRPNSNSPQESGTRGDNGMNTANEKMIFANGEYQCVLVYPPLMDTDMVALRNELMQALKNKTGVNILLDPYLGRDKKFFSGDPGVCNGVSHFLLIKITLRRVNMAVSDFERVRDTTLALLFADLINAVAEFRHLNAVGQSYKFHFPVPPKYFSMISLYPVFPEKGIAEKFIV